jgi:hypothetical protein
MKKVISLGLTFAVVFSALALTGCSGGEEGSAANVVSVEPPKDAPLKPTDMGGGGSTGKAAEGTTQLPPP